MKGSDRTNKKSFSINYSQLEANLQKQIQQDELYWLQNDAKLRAVTQGTPTYEDFRQIVLAAHLKPISREEKEELQRKSAEGKVVWNCAAGSGSGEAVEAGNEFRSLEKQEMRLPRTSGDFTKLWNQLGNYEEKWNVLRYLSGSGGEDRDGSILRKVCREEVSPEIFPDLVGCLREVATSVLEGSKSVECRRDGLEEILLVMKILSESKRFMLTLSFMSKKDRESVGVLLEGLRQALRNEDDSDESRGKAKILSNLFNHIEARYSPQTTDS